MFGLPIEACSHWLATGAGSRDGDLNKLLAMLELVPAQSYAPGCRQVVGGAEMVGQPTMQYRDKRVGGDG
jgi:hypothetical protein